MLDNSVSGAASIQLLTGSCLSWFSTSSVFHIVFSLFFSKISSEKYCKADWPVGWGGERKGKQVSSSSRRQTLAILVCTNVKVNKHFIIFGQVSWQAHCRLALDVLLQYPACFLNKVKPGTYQTPKANFFFLKNRKQVSLACERSSFLRYQSTLKYSTSPQPQNASQYGLQKEH